MTFDQLPALHLSCLNHSSSCCRECGTSVLLKPFDQCSGIFFPTRITFIYNHQAIETNTNIKMSKPPRPQKVMITVKPQEVEEEPDRRRCWVHYSHLSYDDFGRTECFDHWKIAKIFEAGRQFAMSTEVLKFDSLVNEDYTIFVLGVHYKIIPELWTVRAKTVFPYKVSVEVTERGRTSMTVFSEMVNKLNNQVLASAHCKFVNVDRNTRKPVPFPNWYTQKCAAVPVLNKRSLTLAKMAPEVPAKAHCYQMKVAASDTDFNGHTNQGSYVRFCSDAAQAALMAQALSGFQQDIARYPLTEQQVIYIGESSTGDPLQVHVWQPPDRINQIHFVIQRHTAGNQSSVIFQAYMVFQMVQLALPHYARI